MLAISITRIKATLLPVVALFFLCSSLFAQRNLISEKSFYPAKLQASVLTNLASLIAYTGIKNFPDSFRGNELLINAAPITTTTTLTSSLNPSTFGQAVSLKAQVSPTAAKGSVNFMEGTVLLGTVTLDGTNSATLTTTSFSVGNHTITAVYIPKGNYSNSTSAPIVQNVKQGIATVTTLSSSINPSNVNQAVTFTASVSPTAAQGTMNFLDGNTQIGSSIINASGIAVFTTGTLAAGTHPITAAYSGSSTFNSSTSSILSQLVNKSNTISTTTTLSSSPNPSNSGQAVTLNAQVLPSAASGTVSFSENGTALGTGTLNSSGIASITVTSFSVGNHTIIATYNAKANYGGSVSGPVVQLVNALTTSTTVTSSLNPSKTGQDVTFSAQVVPNNATGTVSFRDGNTALGSGVLNSNGIATFTTAALSTGTHSITALYTGSGNFNGSSSLVLVQTVNPVLTITNTTLVSSNNPSYAFGSVGFSAQVTPAGAGGTVDLKEGNTVLGTSQLDENGSASFSIFNLTAGSHAIVAVYNGDASFSTSTSGVLQQAVNKSTTMIFIGSFPNPSNVGQDVTFNADVKSPTANNRPIGTLNIMEGATLLGAGDLNGSGPINIVISNLGTGQHSIRAVFQENENYSTSTSNIITQVVSTPVTITSTSLVSSQNPSVIGQLVTLTANVLPAGASGTVRFKEGDMQLGASALNAMGSASITIPFNTATTHIITALYEGDATFSSSTSPALFQAVNSPNSISTTTRLSSSNSLLPTGQEVILNASVFPLGFSGLPPTGTVTFREGTTILGTVGLDAQRGQMALFAINGLSPGNHVFTAQYSGDANYSGSISDTYTQIVYQAGGTPSVTVLRSSNNPAIVGNAVTFNATITPAGATGSVSFMIDGLAAATAIVDGNGNATYSKSNFLAGNHSISAVYIGDNLFSGGISNNIVQVEYNAVGSPVALTLSSTPNPSRVDRNISFSAQLTPSAAFGTVTFMEGSNVLGVGFANNGLATLNISTLPEGNHNITAVYAGDNIYRGEVSSILTQVVTPGIASSTSITSVPNPSTVNLPITFKVSVSPAGASGIVYFLDNSQVFGAKMIDATGKAIIVTSYLSAGTHTITATYQGDDTYRESNSAPLTQTVDAATGTPTITTLTNTPNPSLQGQTVTFKAHIDQAGATGAVNFINVDDGTLIGSGSVDGTGDAAFSTSTLITGQYQVAAIYLGNGTLNGGTSNTVNQLVSESMIPTNTFLSSLKNPTVVGEIVSLYVSITGFGPVQPNGTVTFTEGSIILGTIPVQNNDGRGSFFEISTLTAGNHLITATYSGQGAYEGSTSNTISQQVDEVITVAAPGIKTSAQSSSQVTAQKEAGKPVFHLNITVSQNPSRRDFIVEVKSNNKIEKIQLRTVDLYGRDIEMREVKTGQTLHLGNFYPPGIYFIEAVQGKKRNTAKLIKL